MANPQTRNEENKDVESNELLINTEGVAQEDQYEYSNLIGGVLILTTAIFYIAGTVRYHEAGKRENVVDEIEHVFASMFFLASLLYTGFGVTEYLSNKKNCFWAFSGLYAFAGLIWFVGSCILFNVFRTPEGNESYVELIKYSDAEGFYACWLVASIINIAAIMHDSINLVEKFVGRKHKYLFFALPCHLIANILSLVACAMTLEQIGNMQNEMDMNTINYLVYARTDLLVTASCLYLFYGTFLILHSTMK